MSPLLNNPRNMIYIEGVVIAPAGTECESLLVIARYGRQCGRLDARGKPEHDEMGQKCATRALHALGVELAASAAKDSRAKLGNDILLSFLAKGRESLQA